MNTDKDRLRRLADQEDGCPIGVGGLQIKLQKLADYLHRTNCTHNHVDMCGWMYEKEWTEYEHAIWLRKAEDLIEFVIHL